MAELTGLTLVNVQQILSRSLRRLRAQIEELREERVAATATRSAARERG